eukprot:TRINITY_DN5894_c0_g1_i2.p1 TRINITY_DN5894_c0_g1~~TRINITY_DN5894_c0_g1_i2.p1  ORF type:complete len:209 (+),score=55.70 TRINITY_DN5894_c0_g1_i2:129-755(+)
MCPAPDMTDPQNSPDEGVGPLDATHTNGDTADGGGDEEVFIHDSYPVTYSILAEGAEDFHFDDSSNEESDDDDGATHNPASNGYIMVSMNEGDGNDSEDESQDDPLTESEGQSGGGVVPISESDDGARLGHVQGSNQWSSREVWKTEDEKDLLKTREEKIALTEESTDLIKSTMASMMLAPPPKEHWMSSVSEEEFTKMVATTMHDTE